VRRAVAVPGLVFLILALLLAPARGEEPPPFLGSLSDTVPVERPAGTTVEKGGTPGGIVPLALLRNAETEFRSGDPAKALSLFLDLAYNFSDDERKGFVWMRVADLLLARQEFRQALDAADKAVLLSRARFLVLSAMDRKFRIYRQLRWDTDARQTAAYLLDQGYIDANPSELLSAMARADGREGKISLALSEYTRAISSAADPGVARHLADERNALIDGLAGIPALWDATQSEENSEIRAHLYLHLGRLAVRRGFSGMGAFALERASRSGGESGEEADRQMSRLEKFLGSRPKIAGLVPLSGKYADLGFAVLCGAEVAIRRSRGQEAEPLSPVLRWMDTEGQPGRARVLFQMASAERAVIGFIGPLTGEEGHSVSAVFDPKSPPVLYLGQKTIPEKPFLYSFGLTPKQEAHAVLSHLARKGRDDLILFHPDGFLQPGNQRFHGGDPQGGGKRRLLPPFLPEGEGSGGESAAGCDPHRGPLGEGVPPRLPAPVLQHLPPPGRLFGVEQRGTGPEGRGCRERLRVLRGLRRRGDGVPGRDVPEGVRGGAGTPPLPLRGDGV